MEELTKNRNYNFHNKRIRQNTLKSTSQSLTAFSKIKYDHHLNPQKQTFQSQQKSMKTSQMLNKFKKFYTCLPNALNLDSNCRQQLDIMWNDFELAFTDSCNFQPFIDKMKKRKIKQSDFMQIDNKNKIKLRNRLLKRNYRKQTQRCKSQNIDLRRHKITRQLSPLKLKKKPTLKQNQSNIKIISDIILMGHNFLVN